MALEPRTSTITVTVQPGEILGLSLCIRSNNVFSIVPGLIEELNKARPGSVKIGDRILEVNGEKGLAFRLINAWIASLTDGSGILRLTVLRPIDFDVAIDISACKELGLDVTKLGFVKGTSSDGMVASYNAKQGTSGATLCAGDRVVQVSGRTPCDDDGEAGNVLPYLRLAMCGGASPLHLRVRRGQLDPCQDLGPEVEAVPAEATEEKHHLPRAALCDLKRRYNRFQDVLKPAAQRLRALRKLGHSTPTPEHRYEATSRVGRPSKDSKFSRSSSKVQRPSKESKLSSEPSTPSTRGPSTTLSQFSDYDSEHFSEPYLTLPGVVRRNP
jgi:hypothetical protein